MKFSAFRVVFGSTLAVFLAAGVAIAQAANSASADSQAPANAGRASSTAPAAQSQPGASTGKKVKDDHDANVDLAAPGSD